MLSPAAYAGVREVWWLGRAFRTVRTVGSITPWHAALPAAAFPIAAPTVLLTLLAWSWAWVRPLSLSATHRAGPREAASFLAKEQGTRVCFLSAADFHGLAAAISVKVQLSQVQVECGDGGRTASGNSKPGSLRWCLLSGPLTEPAVR